MLISPYEMDNVQKTFNFQAVEMDAVNTSDEPPQDHWDHSVINTKQFFQKYWPEKQVFQCNLQL